MQDGTYQIQVAIDRKRGKGQASIAQGNIKGRDSWYEFDGTVTCANGKFGARLTLRTCEDAHLATMPCEMNEYPLCLTGVYSEERFHAVGPGPGGIVIEMKGGRA